MQAKGARQLVRTKLLNWFTRRLPEDWNWRSHSDGGQAATYIWSLRSSSTAPESPAYVKAEEALLVVEIADASLAYDRGRKAQIYASLGVCEFWVVGTSALATCVYREPSATGFGDTVEIAANETLVPLRVAPLAVKLAELGLD